QQDDVPGDAARSFRLRHVLPTIGDRLEEVADARPAPGEHLAEQALDAGERRTLLALAGRPDTRHRARPHERLGAVQPIEVGDEQVEARWRRGLLARPAGEP